VVDAEAFRGRRNKWLPIVIRPRTWADEAAHRRTSVYADRRLVNGDARVEFPRVQPRHD